jgi:DNA-binding MarR family transcriptional regulator
MASRKWREFEQIRDASTGQLLMKAARLWNEQAIGRVQAAGATAFRAAHTRLLPHISRDGIRLTELAERVGITKQAVGKLVDDLEAQGVVVREPDPDDGRALRVRYTDRGATALVHGLGVLADLEREIAKSVGKKRMAELNAILSDVVLALETD